MRTDSDRNLSAEADPNPASKTRERVLTTFLNLILILATFAFNLIPVFYNQVKDMNFLVKEMCTLLNLLQKIIDITSREH